MDTTTTSNTTNIKFLHTPLSFTGQTGHPDLRSWMKRKMLFHAGAGMGI
jgi:hypothetical protein